MNGKAEAVANPSPFMLRQAQHERLKLQARFWVGFLFTFV
jgi:hypothetical protein